MSDWTYWVTDGGLYIRRRTDRMPVCQTLDDGVWTDVDPDMFGGAVDPFAGKIGNGDVVGVDPSTIPGNPDAACPRPRARWKHGGNRPARARLPHPTNGCAGGDDCRATARATVVGQRMYTLTAFVADPPGTDPASTRFFESFRIVP